MKSAAMETENGSVRKLNINIDLWMREDDASGDSGEFRVEQLVLNETSDDH